MTSEITGENSVTASMHRETRQVSVSSPERLSEASISDALFHEPSHDDTLDT